MEYIVTQGPKPALNLIRDISDIVGPPTEDETKEESEAKGERAQIILQEKLHKMDYEEVAILHASLASLYGISKSFYIELRIHLSNLSETEITSPWHD